MINANSKASVRLPRIIKLLGREHPDAKIALSYASPFELLIATILSAQCTDERVNLVTRELFRKYKTPEDYADADLRELERAIKPTGFYRNKAKNMKKCCRMLIERFDSKVPRTMEELLELPGVARKTANVVLSNAYGIIEGIVVDTHVRRVSKRLGLTDNDNPAKIEEDLVKLVPRDYWMKFADLLIFHGRRVCEAKKPKCQICLLNRLCPSAFKFD
jgi:endonuclease-3